mgnify:CR=1 FL=1
MADTQNLVDQLSALTVLEIADLVKQLEEKWGVSAAAPVAVAAAGAPAGGPAAPRPEEKTAFDVILKEAGPNKIAVIKEVRAASLRSRLGRSESPRRRARPKTLKRVSPRKRPKRSRKRSRPLAPRSKSNKLRHTPGRVGMQAKRKVKFAALRSSSATVHYQ